jgi:NADPH:quinone reductase
MVGRLATAAMFLNFFVGALSRGRRGKFYGITLLYRKDPVPFRDDLPKIFALIASMWREKSY